MLNHVLTCRMLDVPPAIGHAPAKEGRGGGAQGDHPTRPRPNSDFTQFSRQAHLHPRVYSGTVGIEVARSSMPPRAKKERLGKLFQMHSNKAGR